MSETAPNDRRGGLSFALVGTVFALLLAIGVGSGLVIHRRYVGFERVVAEHVPARSPFVLRWDVEKVTLFEPTRRYLLPLVDARRPGRPVAAEPRSERLRRATGVRIGRDLREVLLVVPPGDGDSWAVMVGGSFGGENLLGAVADTLRQEGWSASPPTGVLDSRSGLAFGRAADGAYALSSSRAALGAVLERTPEDPLVPREGAGSLVVRLDQPGVPPAVRAVLAPLGDVTELSATADWGSPLPVEVRLRYASAPPGDAVQRLRGVLAELVGARLAELERGTLALEVQPGENQELKARFRLADSALEAVADRAALLISRQIAAPTAGK